MTGPDCLIESFLYWSALSVCVLWYLCAHALGDLACVDTIDSRSNWCYCYYDVSYFSGFTGILKSFLICDCKNYFLSFINLIEKKKGKFDIVYNYY